MADDGLEFQFAGIRSSLISSDVSRQLMALISALHLSAAGKDISSLVPTICGEVIASTATSTCKKLAYDCVRSSRLTADEWDIVCAGMANDLRSIDPDVTAASMLFVTALPSWRVVDFISDYRKAIDDCIVHEHPHLRRTAVESMGCLLARDDVIAACSSTTSLLEKANKWWDMIARSTLDTSDLVSGAAFEAIGRLFSELSTKRLSQLAVDKLLPSESSLAVRSQFVIAMIDNVWSKRDLFMSRAALLPLDHLISAVYPLVFAARAVATGALDDRTALTGNPNMTPTRARRSNITEDKDFVNAERILGVSDIVSFLNPYLSSSLNPGLVYEVGIHVLSLAGVPGGKPEWASGPITAFLTLWDRQEYSAGQEAIVRAVVSNLQLLDLHMQVGLFRHLLVMVRNLGVEADRMHALACICRTALCVDLFVRESARRGQKPIPGTDIAALFEDPRIRDEFSAVPFANLFREELLACLVETTFQLSQPMPASKAAMAAGSRVSGALAMGAGYDSWSWTQSAIEVLETCRGCVRWDCEGRTYALDCYLRLLVQLCLLYDTAGGVKTIQDGSTTEQVQAAQRLQTLQRQLLDNLQEVATPRMRVRLLWVLAEHLDLSGTTPLFADEPREPLNILVATMHRILFGGDLGAGPHSNRLQDVQAILVCAQHLGSRNYRAAALLARELEDFRGSGLADTVNQQHIRFILSILAHIQKFPERKWAARVGPTGEYPFTHHKTTVQYHESAAAQDRKLETVVKTAVDALWRPAMSELDVATRGAAGLGLTGLPSPLTPVPSAVPTKILGGSSDPVVVEAFHLSDASEHRITLHMKILNLTEVEVERADVQVGLRGALRFMDGAPRAVRQLRQLGGQDSVKADVTVTAARFERCAFCVQLAYHVPFSAGSVRQSWADDEYSQGDEGSIPDDSLTKTKKRSTHNAPSGDTVILRCKPYRVPLTDLLLPYPLSPVEFFRLVASLPAMREHTGKYRYETNERSIVLSAEEIGVRRFLAGLRALDKKPLHKVCQHMLRSKAGFQLCYSAKTWYGDILAIIILGTSDIPADGGLGDTSTIMLCKFILKASAQHVLDEILGEPQDWLDDLTDGAVLMVSEEELRAELEEKQRKTAEHIAVLRKSLKDGGGDGGKTTASGGIPLPGFAAQFEATEEEEEEIEEAKLEDLQAVVEKERRAMPVIPEEQRALQSAVLHAWSLLRAQQLEVQAASMVRA
eukprot:TRINITY_DN1649_c0_g2_i1.p1 TRINITY_DN1649_c0_g2~~TRINITY_DN1649_c0_g2_i1.p1  ORF type:complete len:1215 (+),score=196.81 TRINITY_DN1649_c0_g2_i1:636-4280(+)